MSAYLYCLENDYTHKSRIRKHTFENEWLRLEKNGNVTVKGSWGLYYAS